MLWIQKKDATRAPRVTGAKPRCDSRSCVDRRTAFRDLVLNRDGRDGLQHDQNLSFAVNKAERPGASWTICVRKGA
jgi:hypothetical protein